MIKILAGVADVYTPTLLIISLFFIVQAWRHQDKLAIMQFFLIVISTYGLMFLDKKYKLWEALELDYSTHTAAALGLIVFIGVRVKILACLGLLMSLVVYACLMKLLNYHSFADIFSTICAIFPIYGLIIYFVRSKPVKYPLFN